MLFFRLNSQMYNLDTVAMIDFEGSEGLIELFFINGAKVALVEEGFEDRYDLDTYPGTAYILPSATYKDFGDMLASLDLLNQYEDEEEEIGTPETEEEEQEEPAQEEIKDGNGKDKESPEPEA